MSTPQHKDTMTKVANDLFDAILGGGFSHREQSVIFTIIRKTSGHGLQEAAMSAAEIGAMCGTARPHVTSTLNVLAARHVITKRQGQCGTIVGIQTDYRRWLTAAQLKSQPSAEHPKER